MDKFTRDDIVVAFCPKVKYLTHGKKYVVRWMSVGGNPNVRDDSGRCRVYRADTFIFPQEYDELCRRHQ